MATRRASRKNTRRNRRHGGASCNGTVSIKNAMARKNCQWERTANGMAKLVSKNMLKNNNYGYTGGRSNRGVFSTLYSPVSGLVRTAGNVAHSGLNTAYAVPATFAKGAKNTVRNSLNRLVRGANNVGKRAFSGVNRSIRSVFRGRKNRRNTRRNTRRNNY